MLICFGEIATGHKKFFEHRIKEGNDINSNTEADEPKEGRFNEPDNKSTLEKQKCTEKNLTLTDEKKALKEISIEENQYPRLILRPVNQYSTKSKAEDESRATKSTKRKIEQCEEKENTTLKPILLSDSSKVEPPKKKIRQTDVAYSNSSNPNNVKADKEKSRQAGRPKDKPMKTKVTELDILKEDVAKMFKRQDLINFNGIRSCRVNNFSENSKGHDVNKQNNKIKQTYRKKVVNRTKPSSRDEKLIISDCKSMDEACSIISKELFMQNLGLTKTIPVPCSKVMTTNENIRDKKKEQNKKGQHISTIAEFVSHDIKPEVIYVDCYVFVNKPLNTQARWKNDKAYEKMLDSKSIGNFFKCMHQNCIFTHYDKEEFSNHLSSHVRMDLFIPIKMNSWQLCAYCDVIADSVAEYLIHLESHENDNIQCCYCFHRTASVQAMGEHLTNEHSGCEIKCIMPTI